MARANPCENFLGRFSLAALALLVSRVGIFEGDAANEPLGRQGSEEGGQVFRGNLGSARGVLGETAASMEPRRLFMRQGAQPARRIFLVLLPNGFDEGALAA